MHLHYRSYRAGYGLKQDLMSPPGPDLVFGDGGQASLVTLSNGDSGDSGNPVPPANVGDQSPLQPSAHSQPGDQPSVTLQSEDQTIQRTPSSTPTTALGTQATATPTGSQTTQVPTRTSVASTSPATMQTSSSMTTLSSSSSATEAAGTLSSSLFTSESSAATTTSQPFISLLGSTTGSTSQIASSLTSTLSSTTPSSSSPSASTAAATDSIMPTSATGRSTDFYIGVSFATIVAIACILSFSAWLLRSQQRTPGWCWGKRRRDDIEDHDLGFGLGGYGSFLEGTLHESPRSSTDLMCVNKNADDGDLTRQQSITNHHRNEVPLAKSFSVSYPTPRPCPAYLRDINTDTKFPHNVGPLQVVNCMTGDALSNSNQTPQFISHYDPTYRSPNLNFSGTEYGTPREAMPRFMGLEGHGLDVPWAPLPHASSHGASHSRASSISRKSTKDWENLPPLPLPGQMASEHVVGGSSGGWGASLRSSLLSAFSAVTGQLSRSPSSEPSCADDNLTVLPSRPARCYRDLSRQSTMRSFASAASKRTLEWRLEETRKDAGVVQFSPLGFDRRTLSTATAESLEQLSVGRNMSYDSTSPLIVAKKTRGKVQPRRTYQLSDTGPAPESGAPTRSSSRYSSAPTDLADSRRKASKAKGSTAERVRPNFFKRASSSGCSSASCTSDSSSSSDLTDGEMLAKRLLALRERRKKSMGVGRGMGAAVRIGKVKESMRLAPGGSRKGFKRLDKRS